MLKYLMKIGLFIPCFVNELYPDSAMATLRLLEKFSLDVEYPLEQTCCGQAFANSGCEGDVEALAHRFVDIFYKYDYIVAPGASCVVMVKEHYGEFFKDDPRYQKIRDSIYEVGEFLHDVIKPKSFDASFPYRVGVHNSCHGVRSLNLSTPSELNIPHRSKLKNLLSMVPDIKIVELDRDDECCGFGGSFSVIEPEISKAMGESRIKDHLKNGAEVITGADLSCLMHLDGLIRKNGQSLRVLHISQILLGERV
jgi:L-lactate dehydrogenase complex protein LldE